MLFSVIKRKAKMQKHVMKHSRKVIFSYSFGLFALTNRTHMNDLIKYTIKTLVVLTIID